MTEPTAYVTVERLTNDRQDLEFVEGYAWDTDKQTFQAFEDAKKRFSVPFEYADYWLDLFSDVGEQVETLLIAELGYRTLTKV